MKIYLDYIFFENLIINIVIIYQTSIFTKSNIKLKYIILSSSVLSVYTTIVYILQNNIVENIIIKIIVIGFAIYLAFNPKSIKEYIKKQVYYYIISFTYVGIIISITLIFNISIKKTIVKILIYVLSAFISYLFNKYLWKMWKTNIKNSSLTYKLKIKGQEIVAFVIKNSSLTYKLKIKGQEIVAFVDTGNNVYDYTNNLDVIFVDMKFFDNLKKLNVLKNRTNIIVRTIASEDYITGYIVEDVEVYQNSKKVCNLKKVVFCFSNQTINLNNKYNALIGYNLYLENLKGVTL